jgi:hypothetical protein
VPFGRGEIMGWLLIELAVVLFTIVSMWKVFEKAGERGWACLIPIYNFYVLLRIGEQPAWWLLLLFIPFVNFIVVILVMISVANRFGRGAGFGLGLTFLPFVFFPVLAFQD